MNPGNLEQSINESIRMCKVPKQHIYLKAIRGLGKTLVSLSRPPVYRSMSGQYAAAAALNVLLPIERCWESHPGPLGCNFISWLTTLLTRLSRDLPTSTSDIALYFTRNPSTWFASTPFLLLPLLAATLLELVVDRITQRIQARVGAIESGGSRRISVELEPETPWLAETAVDPLTIEISSSPIDGCLTTILSSLFATTRWAVYLPSTHTVSVSIILIYQCLWISLHQL